MHYYHIRTNYRSGFFFEANETRQYGANPGDKVLLLDADDASLDLFATVGPDYFVTNALKMKMEKFPFSELGFLRLDVVLTLPGSQDERENFDENGIWKVDVPSSGELRDFYLWDKRFLVVSDRALKFLIQNDGYADSMDGIHFGVEFTVLANRFYIPEGNLDEYFNRQYLKDMEALEQREGKIMGEYRRRQGLPPLS
jgi:hypothetical protein